MAGLILTSFCLASGTAHARNAVEPQQCTAIVVPGVQRGTSDGRHEAWVYKARFGRLALEATTRLGTVTDYHFSLNGHAIETASGAVPKLVQTCLHAKGVPPPRPAPRVCTGERFKVIISRPAAERFLMLYGSNAGQWRFCRASIIPIEPDKPKAKTPPAR